MEILNNTYREELISRIINSPETLTPNEISLIKNDQELLELYNVATLCKEASAINDLKIPDIETELINFKKSRKKATIIKRWQPLLRIAAIFVIASITTIVIVAAFNPQIIEYITNIDSHVDIETIKEEENTLVSTSAGGAENISIINNEELIYDNITLKTITCELSEIYGIDIVFENENATELRLYLKIERGKTIQEIVNILQGFELFTTTFKNNTLTIS